MGDTPPAANLNYQCFCIFVELNLTLTSVSFASELYIHWNVTQTQTIYVHIYCLFGFARWMAVQQMHTRLVNFLVSTERAVGRNGNATSSTLTETAPESPHE